MSFKPYVTYTLEDWHAIRRQITTATEAASLLGLDSYSTVGKMLENKHSGVFLDNSYIFLGQQLEGVVVAAVNKLLNREFTLYETEPDKKTIFADLELKLGATPDAQEDKSGELLECKTTGPKNYYMWDGIPPLKYLAQLQVQLICTGKEWGNLAILCTNMAQTSPKLDLKLSVFRIPKLAPFQEALYKQLKRHNEALKDGKVMRVDRQLTSSLEMLLTTSFKKIY